MTLSLRRLLATLAFAAAPLPAQIVGSMPSQSPYTDATGRHVFTLGLGYLTSVDDPAGVGPSGGVMVSAAYDYDFPSAFYLTTRLGVAPASERNVVDPLFSGPQRNLGTRREPLVIVDGALGASLTGEKAWRGISPRVFAGFGYIGATNADFDIGQYRFGSKFLLNIGLNVRGVTGKHWEWRADLTRNFYRMNYPALYSDDRIVQGTPVIAGSNLNPWTSQTFLSVGLARVWGR